ncbi:hypothetical protein F5Y16DRAFT_370672 [Xylariaceae sp. FL0255]|nr:hypothetical protein F5Y16DRAFT_370672 [Xylariaceae sp. FL0255]
MDDKKADLIQYARDYAASEKDLYELLSVPPDAAQPEVHRAWRKASLKHHPDKAINFDPEIWQLFERARDVLSYTEARSVYDNARAAAVQRARERAALDAKRREMIDDLEARERGVKRVKTGEDKDERHWMMEAKKKILMERGNKRMEERRRLMAEAEARDRERERLRKEKEDAEKEEAGGIPEEEKENTSQTQNETSTGAAEKEAKPPPASGGDDLDQRIAEIEQRLAAKEARKAAKKAEKKQAKSQKHSSSSADHLHLPPPATSDTVQYTNTKPTTTETLPPEPIPIVQTPNSAPSYNLPSSKPGDFSSTMARLRAAQREKERKKAAAAAASAMETS